MRTVRAVFAREMKAVLAPVDSPAARVLVYISQFVHYFLFVYMNDSY